MKLRNSKKKWFVAVAIVSLAVTMPMSVLRANADTEILTALETVNKASKTYINHPPASPYLLDTLKGTNTHRVYVNNKAYWYTPSEADQVVLPNLVNTGFNAIVTTDASNAIFQIDETYYTYNPDKLITNNYSIIEGTPDNYIFKIYDSNMNPHYYTASIPPSTFNSDHTTFSDSSEGAMGSFSIQLPNEATPRTYYYKFSHEGADVGERTENPTSSINNTVYRDLEQNGWGGAIYTTEDHSDVDINADFINNKGTKGGAIAVVGSGKLGNIKGDFIDNSSLTGDNGGAILASGTARIESIDGTFINNTAKRGGAIANGDGYDASSRIERIKGNFFNNGSIDGNGGGAIYNAYRIGYIGGSFIGNYAIKNTSNYEYSWGGAINTSTYTSIDSIAADFIGNYAKNTANTFQTRGGAINLSSYSTIGSIIGDFVGNYADSLEYAYGGAIYLGDDKAKIGDITGNFIGNYVTANDKYIEGGAIMLESYTYGGTSEENTSIDRITGNFIDNYTQVKTKNQTARGGAISVHGDNRFSETNGITRLGAVEGNFINNHIIADDNISAKAYGGAIFNITEYGSSYDRTENMVSRIGKIKGNFVNNYIKGSRLDGYGGAIYNQDASIGEMDENYNFTDTPAIEGDFIGNYTEYGAGGAIYNYGHNDELSYANRSAIGLIKGNFKDNKSYDEGGAIYNKNAQIAGIQGNFINNDSESDNGGAIFNDDEGLIGVKNSEGEFVGYAIEGNFTNNDAEQGGAIYNEDSEIGFIKGNFEDNTAIYYNYGYGGAIYNEGTMAGIEGNFSRNIASEKGGAIYQEWNAEIGDITGDFTDNNTEDRAYGGAIYNYSSTIGNITGDFTGNYGENIYSAGSDLNAAGGAIYNETGTIGNITGNFVNNTLRDYEDTAVTGTVQGGAIYNQRATNSAGEVTKESTIGIITGDFKNNSAVTLGGIGTPAVAMGGAIYNDGVIGSLNEYGYLESANLIGDFENNKAESQKGYATGGAIHTTESIWLQDSNIKNNSAISSSGYNSLGGAIYSAGGSVTVEAATEDIEISGNKATLGAFIFQDEDEGEGIFTNATGGDVVVQNNNSTGTAGGSGTGIYSGSSLFLSTENGHSITINDNIDISNGAGWGYLNVSAVGGDVNINGALETGANAGMVVGSYFQDSEGALNLGVNAANTTQQTLQYASKAKLSLQNSHAGDNLVIGTIAPAGSEPELKLNVDYDATANIMDKLTVNAGSGKITLNAVNVLNDNEDFVDGTQTEYLDGAARANIVVRDSAVISTVAGTTAYTFTPEATHGVLSVTRGEIPYLGDLIDAIQDDVETIHPTAYSLQENFTADRDFGALNTANREDFTIFGNNYTISGNNTYTGIEVANGQTLNIQDAKFISVKNYDIKNEGTLNLSGQNQIDTITDSNSPTGVININGGNTIITGASVTQDKINLKGGRFVANYGNTINADVVASADYSSSWEIPDGNSAHGGALYNGNDSVMSSVSGTFNANTAVSAQGSAFGGAISNQGTITSLSADFTNNSAVSNCTDSSSSYANGGAIYNGINDLALSGSTLSGNSASGANVYARGGAIYNLGNLTIADSTVASNSASGIYAMGGAITSRPVDDDMALTVTDSTFTGNTATASNGDAYGGAVYQYGGNLSISDVTFGGAEAGQGNSVTASGNAYGGAIYNTDTISSLIQNSTFSGNSANVSGSGAALGGAIYNGSSSTLSIDSSTFTNNSATRLSYSSKGGAIYNTGNVNISNSIFGGNSDNQANTAQKGGAIYSYTGIITLTDTDFIGNEAAMGGAIYAEGLTSSNAQKTVDNETVNYKIYKRPEINIIADNKDVLFKNNTAYDGAAIRNSGYLSSSYDPSKDELIGSGNVTLFAKNHDITFEDNDTLDDDGSIHLSESDLILNANAGHNITINDTIELEGSSSSGSNIAVNNQEGNTGNVILNNEIIFTNNGNGAVSVDGGTLTLNDTAAGSMANNNLNLNGGSLKLGSEAAEAFENANLKLNGGTFDIANDAIDDLTFTNAINTAVNSYIALDVDLSGTTVSGDKITADYADGNTSAITISALNFINDNYTGSEEDHEITIADGTIKSLISETVDPTVTGATNSYTYSYDQDTGILTVSLATYTNIYDAVHDTEKAVRTYKIKLAEGETITQALGAMEGTSLTVEGNNKYLDGRVGGTNQQGIVVADGQELTLKNLSSVKNFTTAVDNAGTLNVENVEFANNTTDINNTATLNLSGTNKIDTITGATGTTNITDGLTTINPDGSVTQNAVNMQGGGLLVRNHATINKVIADENYTGSHVATTGGIISSFEGTFKGSNEYNALDYNSDAALNIDGVTFDSNSAGAIYHSWSGLVDSNLSNLTFTNNSNVLHDGGAYYQHSTNGSDHTVSFDNATFTSNSAPSVGGAVLAELNFQNKLNISNSTFTSNTVMHADGTGSAIYLRGYAGGVNTPSSYTIDNSTFTSNGAGGVVYADGGDLTVKDSTFTSNLGDAIVLADDNTYWAFIGGHPTQVHSYVTANIVAETGDVAITDNDGWAVVGNNNHDTDSAITLYAKSGDILIDNNTAGGINNNGMELTLNADYGHSVTMNDDVTSTTGMTINAGGNHTGVVALNGELTLGDKVDVAGGTLKLNNTAAESIAAADLKLNGGKFDIANSVIDDLTFTNAIDNAADSYLALDVDLGDALDADIITADVSGDSTIYISDLNVIADSKNGGEVQVADGNVKGAIALSADVAGGYADVKYNNSTGVLSFADKIDWLQQTLGNESGYRFTKVNNGIMPVNYTSGENNYTFYTEILRKNYVDNNSTAHDLKYTWNEANHLLTVTNSDDTAVASTTMSTTGAGSAADPYVLTGDYTGNNNSLGFARWDRVASITGDFIGNTKGGIGLGMGITIGDITGNFIGNSGGRAFSFSGDHSWI